MRDRDGGREVRREFPNAAAGHVPTGEIRIYNGGHVPALSRALVLSFGGDE